MDRTSVAILRATSAGPRTPGQIARAGGVPVVECWRRVRKLAEMGLVRLVMIDVTPDGRTLRFFQASLPLQRLVETASG